MYRISETYKDRYRYNYGPNALSPPCNRMGPTDCPRQPKEEEAAGLKTFPQFHGKSYKDAKFTQFRLSAKSIPLSEKTDSGPVLHPNL